MKRLKRFQTPFQSLTNSRHFWRVRQQNQQESEPCEKCPRMNNERDEDVFLITDKRWTQLPHHIILYLLEFFRKRWSSDEELSFKKLYERFRNDPQRRCHLIFRSISFPWGYDLPSSLSFAIVSQIRHLQFRSHNPESFKNFIERINEQRAPHLKSISILYIYDTHIPSLFEWLDQIHQSQHFLSKKMIRLGVVFDPTQEQIERLRSAFEKIPVSEIQLKNVTFEHLKELIITPINLMTRHVFATSPICKSLRRFYLDIYIRSLRGFQYMPFLEELSLMIDLLQDIDLTDFTDFMDIGYLPEVTGSQYQDKDICQ